MFCNDSPFLKKSDIHEMLKDIDEKLLKYVPDYRINLISPVTMDKLEIEKFKTDFRELSEFIKYKQDKKAMVELMESDRFQNMDILTANLISNLTNVKLNFNDNRGDKANMRDALDEIREDARQEGLNKGLKQGIIQGEESKAIETAKKFMALGVNTIEQIASCTGLSLEKVKSLSAN